MLDGLGAYKGKKDVVMRQEKKRRDERGEVVVGDGKKERIHLSCTSLEKSERRSRRSVREQA